MQQHPNLVLHMFGRSLKFIVPADPSLIRHDLDGGNDGVAGSALEVVPRVGIPIGRTGVRALPEVGRSCRFRSTLPFAACLHFRAAGAGAG